ncbi:hypothetical protein BH11ARM2_BH11ARM2_24120 [soil metagenome]
MDRRAFGWTTGICYGAAAVAALLGLVASLSNVQLHTGALLLGLAGLFAFAGYRTYEALREVSRRLERNQTRLDHLQERLDRQQATVDDLADQLDMGLFICDRKGTVRYANRRAIHLFGLPEMHTRPLLALTLSNDLEKLVHRVSEGEAASSEITFVYPQDWVGLAKAWTGSDGMVFLSVFEITDLRRLERIRTDFVANVSHEMRTPMTIIRAMSETLLDDEDGELKERYLTKIISEVDRLSTISQDLLVLSAAESNPVRKQSCDLAGVLRDAGNQLRGKAESKGLELGFCGPDRLVLEANPAQMIQVALNLIENAINYTPEGGVRIALCRDENTATFSVTDSGIGIAPEHQDRIFERFYRADKARSRFTGGTGLGLSIVKHIVEAHGGAIEVASTLNEGSVFTVHLPISGAKS